MRDGVFHSDIPSLGASPWRDGACLILMWCDDGTGPHGGERRTGRFGPGEAGAVPRPARGFRYIQSVQSQRPLRSSAQARYGRLEYTMAVWVVR